MELAFSWGNFGYIFYLAPVLIFSCFLLFYNFFNQKKYYKILTFDGHFKDLLVNFSLNKKLIKIVLLVLALLSLIVAIARPGFGKTEEKIKQEGRDLFVAIDISRSMLSNDVGPNRLEFAKQKIKDLINSLNTERVGLMIFASSAIIQTPLTTDYQVFKSFLDSLDVDTVSSGSTDIGQALQKAVSIFEDSPGKKTKLLFVLTDGEDFSQNLEDIKNKIVSNSIHVITMGIGTAEGGPVPVVGERGNLEGHQKDEHGNIIISKLNEKVLRDIASKSGGIYLRASKDDTDVKKIKRYIERFESEQYEDRDFSLQNEKYFYFAFISLILLILEWLL